MLFPPNRGFNICPIGPDGTILEHWCNDDELRFALNAWIDGRGIPGRLGPCSPDQRVNRLITAIGNQPLGNQFEIHPALTSNSCATSVNWRFSFVMVKFSKCARSRILFNFAIRAMYFALKPPISVA